MNAFLTAAIPFLCCAVTFLVVGLAQGSAIFMGLGASFLAAGIPMLVLGVQRGRGHGKKPPTAAH